MVGNVVIQPSKRLTSRFWCRIGVIGFANAQRCTPQIVGIYRKQFGQPAVKKTPHLAAVPSCAPIQRLDKTKADRIEAIGAALAPCVELRSHSARHVATTVIHGASPSR